MHIETERKFLIKRPDTAVLKAQGGRVMHITQTYLMINDGSGEECRVRRIREGEKTTYVFTEKKRITAVSRYENEYEITKDEYDKLISEAEAPRQLTKTRYAFPYGERTVEIDVYPRRIGGRGLDGRAVLEVEMESESERLILPEFIEIERELTGKKEFSNKSMAKPLPKGEKCSQKPENPAI